MNNFCKRCNHSSVPVLLKEKFNETVSLTFLECPTDDKLIVGCLIKKLEIDWIGFFKHLTKQGFLKDNELSKLKKEGWGLPNREGSVPPSETLS